MAKIDFLGKGDVAGHHLAVPIHTLEADKQKSIGKTDLDGNLIIHGDNLLALKALLPRYEGKVKCVYIDPPYNTGNGGWVYNDEVNSPIIKDWLGKVVDNEDQSRHDKWLCMMYPRLQLLRDLLADDGVIFISIDDNEHHRLRMIMDEIFGAENFVGCITREQKKGANRGTHIAPAIDYIMVYSQKLEQLEKFHIKITEEYIKSFKLNDNDKKGSYKLTNLYEPSLEYFQNCRYQVECPDGEIVITPEGKSFTHNKESFQELLDAGSISFIKAKSSLLETIEGSSTAWSIKRKLYLNDMMSKGRRPSNLLLNIINAKGTAEINSLNIDFNYAKPSCLIKFILNIINDPNAIVIDSFAGSGTTAHATLALNREDGGNRKFILVECEDYADKTTAERVRRVINGFPKSKDEVIKKGLGGAFTYATLGDEINHEKLLSGEAMPSWQNLARHVFWLASGETLDKDPKENKEGFVGKHKGSSIYLLYKPDIEFMQSNKAVLTGSVADKLGKTRKPSERIIYYSAAAYVSQKDMERLGIVFCQLPWAITKRIGIE